jgi:hypothetical protein
MRSAMGYAGAGKFTRGDGRIVVLPRKGTSFSRRQAAHAVVGHRAAKLRRLGRGTPCLRGVRRSPTLSDGRSVTGIGFHTAPSADAPSSVAV